MKRDDDAKGRIGIGLIIIAAFVCALAIWAVWSA